MGTDLKNPQDNSWTGERLETHINNINTIEHLHRYAIAKDLCANLQVLDIACGTGYGSNLLSQVAANVIGVDIDEASVLKASKTYKKPNLGFISGSCANIPLKDASVDVVISFETLEHHDQHEEMLTEIKRVLKPGGTLMISTPDKKNYSDIPQYANPYHIKELYPNEFEALVKRHFNYCDLYYQKNIMGSLITSEQHNEGFDDYKGDYNAVVKSNNTEGMFVISMASDNPVKKLNASLFNNIHSINHLMDETITRLQQSNSYKLGSFLLAPFRLLDKWKR